MIERVAYRPLRNAPKLAPLITAIGMSFILQNVGLLWRPSPDSPPDLIGSQQQVLDIGGVLFVALRLLRLGRDDPAADRAPLASSARPSTARRCAPPRRILTPRA